MSEVRRLGPYLRPYAPLLVAAFLLLVASGLLESVLIMLLAPIFNGLTPGAEAVDEQFAFLTRMLGLEGENQFRNIAFFLIIFSILKGLFLYCAEYAMSYSGQRVVAALRLELNEKLLEQSAAFFRGQSTGRLMARVITDTERLQEAVSKTVTDFLRQCVLLVVFLGLVLWVNWQLALLSFAIAPLVLVITLALGKAIRRVSLRSQQNLSEISHALQETIVGHEIVKGFGMESYERRRFGTLVGRLVGSNLKAARISAVSSPLMEAIGYVAFVPFLLYANHQMQEGLSVESFVVFIAALFRLYEPVRKLSRMHLHVQQAAASAQRVFELIDSEVQVADRPGARTLAGFEELISFDDVSFHYPGGDSRPVLKDVDLNISRGEIVALVGPSGAGKTTLAGLIPRFYDATRGAVRIDGHDVRDLSLESLRRQIAIVTQETFLFDDTLRNNIAYGREDCSLDDVVKAAQASYVDEFAAQLPEGYDTRIGERGQSLSGGQRQRIAIARALLKDAPILILDEATSSLDTESEQLVQRALEHLMSNCTTLVIAHRLSTVRKADRILVMAEGRVVEEGSHQVLMGQSGIYRRLYELQFADTALSSGA